MTEGDPASRFCSSPGKVEAMARALLLLSALLVTGCNQSAPPPLVIGHVGPLRGAGQAAGHSALQGVRLAVLEVNRTEGQKLDQPVVVVHANATEPQAY